MNQNGQVSIPARLRKELRLKPASWVRVEKDEDGRLILTPVELTRAQRELSTEEIQKYETQGVDLSLIRANLKLTPTERLQNNMKMLELMEQIQGQARKGKKPS